VHALVDATYYSSDPTNRKEIAKAIAPRNYLNQPEEVVEQVLTGQFPDGLGNSKDVPDRINFHPFPWRSMAVWIMTQLKRWGYLKQDVNYRQVAEEIFRVADCTQAMKDIGRDVPPNSYAKHTIMGKEFDPADPEGYLNSFAIKRI
jgi:nitrate/nitrite transport system substrate-binding protein